MRGWLRRFGRDVEAIRAHFSRWAFALDVELGPVAPAGGVFADAVAVVGVAARAFVLRFGPGDAWPIVARLERRRVVVPHELPLPAGAVSGKGPRPCHEHAVRSEWEEWRREVALFRYALVRDPADPALSSRQRGRLVRELAGARAHRPGRPPGPGRALDDR